MLFKLIRINLMKRYRRVLKTSMEILPISDVEDKLKGERF